MTTPRTIHVIDDEPIILEVLGQLLTSEGYEVENSSSGEDALQKYETRTFDLVLLDLMMPGMSGLDVLRALHRIHPQALVIIITAYASVESAIEAMKIGMMVAGMVMAKELTSGRARPPLPVSTCW